ncbi:MAG: lipoate--protein ligase family protein [Verrucomicrobiae bacterium]|nr:lipoate--protein ligase family protein [Verrucomicrobiae bacterium]
MKVLDCSESSPERDLALDEALLEVCEEGGGRGVLRLHASGRTHVVVGFGNRVAAEVDVEACEREGVPVLRRVSGGGTVVLGPGCLAYALVLPIDGEPELASVTGTNRWVMERQRAALESVLGRPVAVAGHTDLVVDGRKFSGNAQRRRRRMVLFHGTLLLDFDLPRIGRLLRMPSQQPEYREGRDHAGFVTNLGVPAGVVKEALRRAWGATEPWEVPVEGTVQRLMDERYGQATWHRRR